MAPVREKGTEFMMAPVREKGTPERYAIGSIEHVSLFVGFTPAGMRSNNASRATNALSETKHRTVATDKSRTMSG